MLPIGSALRRAFSPYCRTLVAIRRPKRKRRGGHDRGVSTGAANSGRRVLHEPRCDYGRFVEQLTTNVPGWPGTATATHLAAFASAGVTTANWAATRPRSERAMAAVRLVLVMMFSFWGLRCWG